MGVKQALIKTDEKTFFKYWLIFTQPLHKLNDKDIDVTALLLFYYFEFKKELSNDEIAWKLTFDYDTKAKIINELQLSSGQILRNILTSLRKRKVITDNQINPSFIPKFNKDDKDFSLIFKFEING